MRKTGASPVALAFVMELLFLDGRKKLDGLAISALIGYA